MNTAVDTIVASQPPFRDRNDAAEALTVSLSAFAAHPDAIVVGLARGGVPIARHVADALDLALGVLGSHRIGVPGIEAVALGAVAEGNHSVVLDSVAWYIGVPSHVVARLAARARVELERRAYMYRAGQSLPDLRGRTVILVDDGLATGTTFRAAVRALRERRPRQLIAAVPVASRSSVKEVRTDVDELVVLITLEDFETVSASYVHYPPMSDEDVLNLLGRPTRVAIAGGRRIFSDILRDRIASLTREDCERTVDISVYGGTVTADLGTPRYAGLSSDRLSERARGLAILAHGGESSRDNYRNRYIAGRLRLGGYATLRVDLQTREEQRADPGAVVGRFDVERMAARLLNACDWATREGVDGAFRPILIGTRTGAAASLVAAARSAGRIFAVIARGGNVELASGMLPHVRSPVLMIVGSADPETLESNRKAMRSLQRGTQLMQIPRAGNTFEEVGALGAVAECAVKWLDQLHLRSRTADRFSS